MSGGKSHERCTMGSQASFGKRLSGSTWTVGVGVGVVVSLEFGVVFVGVSGPVAPSLLPSCRCTSGSSHVAGI